MPDTAREPCDAPCGNTVTDMVTQTAPDDAPRAAPKPSSAAIETVTAYHIRTKHSLKRYAAGPETLDWDAQPDPFRTFEGAQRLALPLAAAALQTPFADLTRPGAVPPAPLSLETVALLLELSMGLSAWKEFGPDRWSVRCNPSSGNLHPTEAYVLAQGVSDLADGLHHYVSRDHVLEQRCRLRMPDTALPAGRLFIGLSSVNWREAWKYGERAFRYCQLDTGHALAAISMAAAALGWQARLATGGGSTELAHLLGLDRTEDFAGAEAEEVELLIAIDTGSGIDASGADLPVPDDASWTGTANWLDRHPMYRWPVIDEVSAASRIPSGGFADAAPFPQTFPPRREDSALPAADIILGRRSAQRFDARHVMEQAIFWRLMDALLPRAEPPFSAWALPVRVHPVVFVHKVEGLASGVYALPRTPQAEPLFKSALRDDFTWVKPENCPAHLPFYRLAQTDSRGVIRTLSCHQAIAGDSCFSLGMLATFDEAMMQGAWNYRAVFWEAGLIGQVLYLEAEAHGLRGTGIGCYFDDELHQLLGLEGRTFQSMYHFTVGRPMSDPRIVSQPAYPGRTA